MTLQEHLAALRGKGLLHEHAATRAELQQHLDNARDQLGDARHAGVSLLGRFNAAYGASYALLTAAIKMRGYRPGSAKGHRQPLFELLDMASMVGAAAAA